MAQREDFERRERGALELAQALGEAGDVDGAQEAVLQAEGVQRLNRDLEKKHRPEATVVVCEISGIFLSRESAGAPRLDKEGRQYTGWKRIRDKLEELRERNPPPASLRRDGRWGHREHEYKDLRGYRRRDPGQGWEGHRRDDWRGGSSGARYGDNVGRARRY